MSHEPNIEDSFIDQIETIILENLCNEQFGVSELAETMNMSRSNLLRKIKKTTALSASQFIRQVRLKKSMQMLQETQLTVSEISYQVGFGSISYFIKCFREYYGHPPGEVGKGTLVEEKEPVQTHYFKRHQRQIIATSTLFLVLVISFFIFSKKETTKAVEIEKSIAVLPFKNESNNSSNLYFVNGLMESALNNLQKIEDLRVISRTSVEKYRHTNKSIPEIAEELDVNYLVEGSGQRVGDRVLLNIQLIDASTDTPIWVKQYNQKVVDVFDLQNEVAKKIADAIKAKVTAFEMEQIDKKPTENLLAYDYYLQALDPYNTRTMEGLEEAISLFEKAVEEDSQFALAYAYIAFSYYYIDLFQKQKQYTELINNNADKALLYNAKSAESLIAKAVYYMHIKEYRLALPHLEKALEYNPNSSAVVNMLSSLYANYIPNTAKYLTYALKGIQLDIAANDSITKSYIYLNLSNALIQNGFTEEASKYIDESLNYSPNNYFAPYVKAYILYARHRDIEQTKKALMLELQKDTTRLDILQEVAKLHYYQEDYDTAFLYYEKFVEARIESDLDIYPHEDIKIGLVYEKMGLDEKASEFFTSYADFCENDESIYKSVSVAALYAHEGKIDEAIEQLKVFATKSNYQYWLLLFMKMDPVFKPLKNHPEFNNVMQKIDERFWENHSQLKNTLEDQGLIK
ncbi:helix-turn-helix domain-containing protein [Changchengzhania lutea]|uniref:helix-turn-helix domain-containing protein n=1 Tax=Changchengzhania lutea TaxID=2049305 RepID=UPI00115F0FE0|nr:helix-turn-helix domain-containing protein [Changchengzhania lutea]